MIVPGASVSFSFFPGFMSVGKGCMLVSFGCLFSVWDGCIVNLWLLCMVVGVAGGEGWGGFAKDGHFMYFILLFGVVSSSMVGISSKGKMRIVPWEGCLVV